MAGVSPSDSNFYHKLNTATAPKRNAKKPRKKKLAHRARHRLLSIYQDIKNILPQQHGAEEGEKLHRLPWLPGAAKDWPLIANERCGSWYIPFSCSSASANISSSSCYFKSTDGHVGTWNISLKRLNLPLTDTLQSYGGCFLVDSSVRKVLPDSFSRTIPIWACVLNRIVLKYREALGIGPPCSSWDIDLYTPACVVSTEEHIQISNLIDSRVDCLFQSQAIVNPQRLVETVTKPLRPIWVSNGNQNLQEDDENLCDIFNRYLIIICWNPSTYTTTSSSSTTKSQIRWIDVDGVGASNSTDSNNNAGLGFYYTPGAADDHESWARHLRPQLFWEHQKRILDPNLDDDQVDIIIDSIVEEDAARENDDHAVVKRTTGAAIDDCSSCMDQIGTTNLWIGSRRSGRPPSCWNHVDAILNVTEQEYPNMTCSSGQYYLQLSVAEGKRDRTELERWMSVGLAYLMHHLKQGRRVLVHCAQGKDRSVAMALALVVLMCRPLIFPLRIQENDLQQKWDLEMLCQKLLDATTTDQRSPQKDNSSNQDDTKTKEGGCHQYYYLQSGLLQPFVTGLLQENGRYIFLEWAHAQLEKKIIKNNEPLANKESLRIGLHLIQQDREVADPTRSTMQKLNRFFMSSSLYR